MDLQLSSVDNPTIQKLVREKGTTHLQDRLEACGSWGRLYQIWQGFLDLVQEELQADQLNSPRHLKPLAKKAALKDSGQNVACKQQMLLVVLNHFVDTAKELSRTGKMQLVAT